MKLRTHEKHTQCSGSQLNAHALSELIVAFDEGDMDSMFLKDLDVWLEQSQRWEHLPVAMRNKDVITNNHNTFICEPPTQADRERGYLE